MADRRTSNHCCEFCFCCCFRNEPEEIKNNLIEPGENEEGIESVTNVVTSPIEPSFTHDLPQPLLTGHLVTIIGDLLPKCSRFSINFQNGLDATADTPLHFNPRLEENYVVRNSYLNGKWGEEETSSLYRLSLKRPGKFKVSIFMAPDEFLILLNDVHYCSFKFRMPLTKATVLIVNGYMLIESVYTRDASEYPPNELLSLPTLPMIKPENNGPLPNPFTAHLPSDLKTKWQVEIIGKIKLLPQAFYVNLQEGAQIWPHPTVPLHLNPRFYAGQHVVVRNAWYGSWGTEERGLSQYSPGHSFHLTIRWENEEFSVWVNGKMTGIFKSKTRGPVKVDTFHAQGDVILNKIWINKDVKNIFINMEKYSRQVTNGDI